ncbi:MAG: hypothetical protein ISS66_20615 [Desulfobacteraceae bacterium]|nr:hypothetical protein [Desulfobacteraceae bacterium]
MSSIRPEPFGPEFLDTARNPEFIEGLKAEGLMAEGSRTVGWRNLLTYHEICNSVPLIHSKL